MEITFTDEKLRQLCERPQLAQKKLGAPCARKLRTRLADIDAASSVKELIAGRPHPLRGDRDGQFAVDLAGGKRLVFKPENEPVPQREDGSIDWAKVTQVCICFIGDYHD
ncbi:type II toxin-antitoxin system RelE/ParE family toxin [Leptolyngbya sp. KIOST-1]|uniref:type II toxin-antitoxin system RelE/ParE family toxin n=1 Tax=Leptolyngbya sp. KIOST-1 TaxID=1229172 RepID=UPI000563591B|nr:killer suppression protein HigA [Leptolyngbya sp. KIOST-1]